MYGTFAGFGTYHTERGRDVSDYTEAQVNAALLVGTGANDARYRRGFSGEKVGLRSQVDQWPRTGAYDENGDDISSESVPVEAENATYELALQELLSPGSLSKNYTPSNYKSVSVDGAVNVVFADRADASEVQTSFQIVDEIMSPLMVMGSSGLSGDVRR